MHFSKKAQERLHMEEPGDAVVIQVLEVHPNLEFPAIYIPAWTPSGFFEIDHIEVE